jgi:hypothetical protein
MRCCDGHHKFAVFDLLREVLGHAVPDVAFNQLSLYRRNKNRA